MLILKLALRCSVLTLWSLVMRVIYSLIISLYYYYYYYMYLSLLCIIFSCLCFHACLYVQHLNELFLQKVLYKYITIIISSNIAVIFTITIIVNVSLINIVIVIVFVILREEASLDPPAPIGPNGAHVTPYVTAVMAASCLLN